MARLIRLLSESRTSSRTKLLGVVLLSVPGGLGVMYLIRLVLPGARSTLRPGPILK